MFSFCSKGKVWNGLDFARGSGIEDREVISSHNLFSRGKRIGEAAAGCGMGVSPAGSRSSSRDEDFGSKFAGVLPVLDVFSFFLGGLPVLGTRDLRLDLVVKARSQIQL